MKTIALLLLTVFASISSTFANPMHHLVFTEDPTTGLSVTFDGSKLQVVKHGNSWTVLLPGNLSFTSGALAWLDPQTPSLGNVVKFYNGFARVTGDRSISGMAGIRDHSTIKNAGMDFTDHHSISVMFDDEGDGKNMVPDTGATLGFMTLSLLALLGAARFLRL